MNRRVATLAAFILTLAGQPLRADEVRAPLPSGYEPSANQPIGGIYAEVTGLSSLDDAQAIDKLESACTAKGQPVTIEGKTLIATGSVRLYRTASMFALVHDAVNLRIDQDRCVARYMLDRSVTVKPSIDGAETLPYFDGIDLPCAKWGRRSRCSEREIAGLKVTCVDEGDGLVGSYRCVSLREGLTKGLLVASGSYRDDGGAEGGWAFEKIIVDALIDPAVFSLPQTKL